MDSTIDRRTLLRLLGGSALGAGLLGCESANAPVSELASVLGLTGEERRWIAVLSHEEQRRLALALSGPDATPLEDEAVDLAMRVLSARSRLFRYLGYPILPDDRSLCDGLVRE